MNKSKVSYLISAIICVVLGILIIINPFETAKLLCIVIGAAFLVSGISYIIYHHATHREKFKLNAEYVLGIIVSLVGLWALIFPVSAISTLQVIIGIVIIIQGIIAIISSAGMMKLHVPHSGLWLISGIVTFLFGVAVVVMPFVMAGTMTMLIGIALLFDGLSNIGIFFNSLVHKKYAVSVDEKNEQ